MKRIFSAFLSLVMLIGITAGIHLSAYANTYYESEDNDDYSTADYVPINSTIYGVCTGGSDYDWYKFTLDSPAKVDVNFSINRADSDGYWCVRIYKYEGNGNYSTLDYKYIYRYDGSYTFPSLGLPAGTYFVKASCSSSASGVQYSITPKCTYTSNWETEFNDDYSTADPMTFGTTRYGVCTDGNDDDWYKFTLTSSAKIKVNFTQNKSNADGYWRVDIYKYTGNGDYSTLDYKYIYRSDGAYTFSSLGLSKGTYFVKVNSSSYASGIQYGVTVTYSVVAPSSLNVSSRSTSALKLSWSGVSGASGYQLQHKSGNSWKTNTTTSSTSYTVKGLSAGSTYQFRVRAYKKINGKSYYSSWRYLTACAKPATVKLSKVSAQSGHKLKASWQKASGSASGYQIYWAKDKNFKKVVAKTNVSGQKKTSYTGKNFTKGTKYYVKIRAYKTVDGKKYYGSWSNVKSIKAK